MSAPKLCPVTLRAAAWEIYGDAAWYYDIARRLAWDASYTSAAGAHERSVSLCQVADGLVKQAERIEAERGRGGATHADDCDRVQDMTDRAACSCGAERAKPSDWRLTMSDELSDERVNESLNPTRLRELVDGYVWPQWLAFDQGQAETILALIVDWRAVRAERDAAREEIARLRDFVVDVAENWDHDEDAHRYGTTCRVCEAELVRGAK